MLGLSFFNIVSKLTNQKKPAKQTTLTPSHHRGLLAVLPAVLLKEDVDEIHSLN